MFLVELAYNTIKVKTGELELKQEKKMAALQESEVQLNNDDQKVRSFVDKIKEDLLQDIKNEEMEVWRRMEKELDLKILTD